MKRLASSLLIAALATGCAAAPKALGSSNGQVPLRPATATYPSWEHYCALIDGTGGRDDASAKLLRDAGRQGWELILITEGPMFCFKRPLVEEVPGAAAIAEPPTVSGSRQNP